MYRKTLYAKYKCGLRAVKTIIIEYNAASMLSVHCIIMNDVLYQFKFLMIQTISSEACRFKFSPQCGTDVITKLSTVLAYFTLR
jgi:hypothetical protein